MTSPARNRQLKKLWAWVQEPKHITAVVTFGWGIILLTGISSLVEPPNTITHQLSQPLSILWAVCFIAGGALGLVGCPPGWWWVERAGVILTVAGGGVYLSIIALLHLASEGSRLTQAGWVLFGLVMLIARWLRIRGAQVDPRRGLRP